MIIGPESYLLSTNVHGSQTEALPSQRNLALRHNCHYQLPVSQRTMPPVHTKNHCVWAHDWCKPAWNKAWLSTVCVIEAIDHAQNCTEDISSMPQSIQKKRKQTSWIQHLTGDANDYHWIMFLRETLKLKDCNPHMQLSERVSKICLCSLNSGNKGTGVWLFFFCITLFMCPGQWFLKVFFLFVLAVNMLLQEKRRIHLVNEKKMISKGRLCSWGFSYVPNVKLNSHFSTACLLSPTQNRLHLLHMPDSP